MSGLADRLHTIIFSGSIKKGGTWGGEECANYVAYNDFLYETIFWIIFGIFIYYGLNLTKVINGIKAAFEKSIDEDKDKIIPHQNLFNILDNVFLFILFGMWFQVICYKIVISSLVNLLQPCHLSILMQGLSILKSKSYVSSILTLISIPLTVGAVGALAVPATEGLDLPCEEFEFFFQHYVLLISPYYLLVRQNFIHLKAATLSSFVFANWAIFMLHWAIFSPFDRYFQVNVNFFLCPSEGLGEAFKSFPYWLTWPSYRTFLCIFMIVLTIPIWYLYIALAYVTKHLVETRYEESADQNMKHKSS